MGQTWHLPHKLTHNVNKIQDTERPVKKPRSRDHGQTHHFTLRSHMIQMHGKWVSSLASEIAVFLG